MINNISVLKCPVGEPGEPGVTPDQPVDSFCGVMMKNGQIRSLTEEELEELKNLSKPKEV